MSDIKAFWEVSINTTCPRCENDFDITESPDFWDGRAWRLCEHKTPRTSGVHTSCTECGHEFTVDLEH